VAAGASGRGWGTGSSAGRRVCTLVPSRIPLWVTSALAPSRRPAWLVSAFVPGGSCAAGSVDLAFAGAVGGGALGTKPWSSASSTSAVLSRRRARRGAGAAAVTACASPRGATDLTGGFATDATGFLRGAGFGAVLPVAFAARAGAWRLPATGAGALARRALAAGGAPSETSATGGATVTARLVEAFRPGAAARAAGTLSGAFRRARVGAGLRGMGEIRSGKRTAPECRSRP
jgi:hypothetical protein